MFQNGWLLRSSRTLALPSGIWYRPMRIDRRGGRISTELSFALIGAQVGREEVEDVVLARIHAGLERGPRDRRDRRHGRAERPETAFVPQRREVGQLALVEHLFGEPMVHSVEAEDHDPLHPAPPQRSPPEQGPRQQTDRPGEDRDESREDRGEDREERAGQREPGPGTDVGQGRGRGQHDEKHDQQQQTRDICTSNSLLRGFLRFLRLVRPSSALPSLRSTCRASVSCRQAPGSRDRTEGRGRAYFPRSVRLSTKSLALQEP